MSDLMVDGDVVREAARRIGRVAETLADASAETVLACTGDAMPGSRAGAVAAAMSRSWGSAENALVDRQRGLAAWLIDALADFDRADAELAGRAG